VLSSRFEKVITYGFTALLIFVSLTKFGSSVTHTLQCADTAWLIKTGQYIIDHGLPATDPFSWTCHDRPIVIYQWLFAVLLGLLFQQGGLWLVGLATCIAVGLLYIWYLPAAMMRQGVKSVYAFGLLSLVCSPVWFWARPQLASFILIPIFTVILELTRHDGKQKWLWCLPLLMVLWANLHSFWFIGLAMVAAYLLEAILQRTTANSKALLIALCCCLTAVLINPYGWGLIQSHLSFTTEPDFGTIRELQPLLLTQAKYHLSLLLYLILAWCAIIFGRSAVPLSGLILGAAGTIAALVFYRFVPVAILLTWPYAALALAKFSFFSNDRNKELKEHKPLSSYSQLLPKVLPLLAVTCSLYFFLRHFPAGKPVWFTNSDTNIETTQFLKRHPELTKKLLCDPSVGCSLIFENLLPVFIDTRFDFYGRQFCTDFNNCFDAEEGWQQYIEKWQADTLCIDDTFPIYQALLSSPRWLLVFDDDHFSVWLPNNESGVKLRQAIINSMGGRELGCLSEQQREKMYTNFSQKHAHTAISYLTAGKQQLALNEFKDGMAWSHNHRLQSFLQRNYTLLKAQQEQNQKLAPQKTSK
jgi:hypothetical protein